MKTAHNDVKQHNCEFCSKTYFSLDNLKKHVQAIHNNDQDHDCVQEEIFKNNDDVDNHDQEIENDTDNDKSKKTADDNDMSAKEDFVVEKNKGENDEDLESLSTNSDLEIDVNDEDDEPTTDELSTKSKVQDSSDEK